MGDRKRGVVGGGGVRAGGRGCARGGGDARGGCEIGTTRRRIGRERWIPERGPTNTRWVLKKKKPVGKNRPGQLRRRT